MNTMFAAISNRIKDIGVLRILGYARWHILVSFLLESLVIALLGGLLGCALGSLASGTRSIAWWAAGRRREVRRLEAGGRCQYLGRRCLRYAPHGRIGGLVPAFSAVTLKPLDALR